MRSVEVDVDFNVDIVVSGGFGCLFVVRIEPSVALNSFLIASYG